MDIDYNRLPLHIGIIMDGNGRWAKKRGLPRNAGHKVGSEAFKKTVRYCNKIGIKYLTVFAFSTENWARPEDEVKAIISILRSYLSEAKNYRSENVRTRFIGDISAFDEDIRKKIAESETESEGFTGLTLNIAVNYGGREEILHSVREIAGLVKQNKISPDEIDGVMLENHLYTAGCPDVDLLIRTSGEMRISNFLLWQSSYAELVFTDVLWPDFTSADIDSALEEYARRNRRFGGI